MATQHLRCGCVCVGGNAWSYTLCREGHSPENPPGGGRVGAVPPTPAAARKRQAQKGGGPAMLKRAGRYRLDPQSGVSEFVETEGDEDDG